MYLYLPYVYYHRRLLARHKQFHPKLKKILKCKNYFRAPSIQTMLEVSSKQYWKITLGTHKNDTRIHAYGYCTSVSIVEF